MQMKKLILAFVAAGAAIGGVTTATAAINAKQINQQRLIDAGHRSGKLTHSERAQLKAQQRSIAAQERRMRARHNGRLTAQNKRVLHALQRQAGRDIEREKYDGQRSRNKLTL
jgi:hypothetical protein